MEALNKIFTEQDINEVSQKILVKSIAKIKEEIGPFKAFKAKL